MYYAPLRVCRNSKIQEPGAVIEWNMVDNTFRSPFQEPLEESKQWENGYSKTNNLVHGNIR